MPAGLLAAGLFAHLFYRPAAAVVAPARRLDKIIDGVLHGARPQGGAEQFSPGLKSNHYWVEGPDILCQPIGGPFFFRLEGSENAVPDDKNAAVVAVKVFKIASMMHTVVGGRVQYKLQRPRKLANGFGMDPELVDQA